MPYIFKWPVVEKKNDKDLNTRKEKRCPFCHYVRYVNDLLIRHMEEKHTEIVDEYSPEICWRMVHNLSKSGIRVMSIDCMKECMEQEEVTKQERRRFLRFGARLLLEGLTVIDDEKKQEKNRHMEVKKKFAEVDAANDKAREERLKKLKEATREETDSDSSGSSGGSKAPKKGSSSESEDEDSSQS